MAAHDRGEEETDANGDVFVRITNREIWLKLNALVDEMRAIRLDHSAATQENLDLIKRVRALELRFYGILAGIISAVIIILSIAIHDFVHP